MGWNSITQTEIDDIKTDRKSAQRVEKYMVSQKAVYFEGRYLPISDINAVSIHDSTYNPHCCCGRGIPVKKIKIEYGEEKPLILMLEKGDNAKKMVELIDHSMH